MYVCMNLHFKFCCTFWQDDLNNVMWRSYFGALLLSHTGECVHTFDCEMCYMKGLIERNWPKNCDMLRQPQCTCPKPATLDLLRPFLLRVLRLWCHFWPKRPLPQFPPDPSAACPPQLLLLFQDIGLQCETSLGPFPTLEACQEH